MPRYDFNCGSCGRETELVVSYDEVPRCECGAFLIRQFPVQVAILDDPGRREALRGHDRDSRHARWLDENQREIGKRLRSGALEVVND